MEFPIYGRSAQNADGLLRVKIKQNCGLDVADKLQAPDAFLICRSALIKSNAASYGEQFQGMYSMMRGLTVAFLLGGAHNFGYLLVNVATGWSNLAVGILAGAVMLGLAVELFSVRIKHWADKLQTRPKEVFITLSGKAPLILAVVGSVAAGYLFSAGCRNRIPTDVELPLAIVALAALFFTRKSWQSYKFFAWEFAKAVYRDYYNCNTPSAR